MTSNDYGSNDLKSDVDMSAEAVTLRLKRVSQLRRLCVSLGKAQLGDSGPKPPTEKNEEPEQQAPNS